MSPVVCDGNPHQMTGDKKTTMKKKSYAELEKSILELTATNEKLNETIYKVKDLLDLQYYSNDISMFEAIGKIKEKRSEALKKLDDINGRINENLSNVMAENKRLWYMIRVAMKDPTIKETDIVPGTEREYVTGRFLSNPFKDLNN